MRILQGSPNATLLNYLTLYKPHNKKLSLKISHKGKIKGKIHKLGRKILKNPVFIRAAKFY